MYMWWCKVIGSWLPEDQKENLILKNYDNDQTFNPLNPKIYITGQNLIQV